MIALAVDSEFYQERKMRQFLDAVEKGAKVFAHPETARRLEDELDRQDARYLFPDEIQTNEFVNKDVLYAVDMSEMENMFGHSVSGSFIGYANFPKKKGGCR